MTKKPLDFSDTALLREIREMPKVDTHTHIDGSLNLEDLFQEHQRMGSNLQFPDEDFHGNLLEYSSPEEKVIDTPEKLLRLQHETIKKYKIEDSFRPAIQAMTTKEGIMNMILAKAYRAKKENIVADRKSVV